MKTIEEMKARLAEIVNKLGEFENLENYNDEVLAEIEALHGEHSGLQTTITAKEKIIAMKAMTTSSTRKVAPTAPEATISNKRQSTVVNAGFNSFGEFLMATKKHANGDTDARFANTLFEKHGQDGGFLVPEDFMAEINKKIGSDESLLSKTRRMTVSGNGLTINTDETQPWTGGVQAYWTGEGKPITKSGIELGQASFRLHKLACLIPATEELLEDAVALESYIKTSAPAAIVHKLNDAIIAGDGVAKPEGILGSSFGITVSKESGQLADTIVARNVIKMYSKMIPLSRSNAAFYINPECEEQLRTMKDDQGNFIYLAAGSQMNQTPYAILMGRPVIPMLGSLKQLGDRGDIVFADLSYYWTIVKGGIKSAVSQHLYFDRDETAFKFTMRVDGKCPFKTPVKVQYGSYEMSAFITLEDRA